MNKNESKMQEMNIPKWDAKFPIMIYEVDSPHGIQEYIPAVGIDDEKDIHADWVIQVAQIVTRNKIAVYCSAGSGNFEEVVDYCMAHNIRIISTSFKTSYSDKKRNAIKRFADWGGVWVSAAGNTSGLGVRFPASDPNSIATSATNSPDCDGPEIDISIPSWWHVLGLKGKKTGFNGTSSSNPATAGIVSYILTANPSWNIEDVRKFIIENSIPGEEKYEKIFKFPEEFSRKEKKEMVFNDIKEHWAKKAIEKVAEAGLIEGFSDGTFKPDLALTRAEAAVIFERLTNSK